MGSRVAAAMALVASLPACEGLLSVTVKVGGRDATVEFGGGDDAARLEAIAYDFIVARRAANGDTGGVAAAFKVAASRSGRPGTLSRG